MFKERSDSCHIYIYGSNERCLSLAYPQGQQDCQQTEFIHTLPFPCLGCYDVTVILQALRLAIVFLAILAGCDAQKGSIPHALHRRAIIISVQAILQFARAGKQQNVVLCLILKLIRAENAQFCVLLSTWLLSAIYTSLSLCVLPRVSV